MFYIFLSICCSVTVLVLLKLAKRYQIDVYQAITWNYSAAIFLTWLFFRPQQIDIKEAPVFIYLSLGILLPLLFVIIATSIKLTGIVRTDVAQRLSLFIPVLAAFLIFGEKPNTIKIIGIAIGFVAMMCLIPWKQRNAVRRRSTNAWFYLMAILVGLGVIDILLKSVSKSSVSFGTSLFAIFVIAFLVAFIGLIYMVYTKKMHFSWPHILIGWVLGAANFGNILFYVKGLNALADHPSTVFSTMDVGVIVAGSLVGLFIFREKLSRLNVGGIILAIIAVVIIYFPEIFNF